MQQRKTPAELLEKPREALSMNQKMCNLSPHRRPPLMGARWLRLQPAEWGALPFLSIRMKHGR